jgi:hypothetical protein
MNPITQTVDSWINEEEIPVSPVLKIIRKKDPSYGMSEEEVQDRKEFIRCYLLKDFELILQIPIRQTENDFWFSSYQEFMESAFNTHDYQKSQKPFNKYGYRIKKVMEEVTDLAILHSSISRPEGRANIKRRYETLVDNEFRDRLPRLFQRYQKAWTGEQRYEIRKKVAELNRRIIQCKKVWEEYAHWE